MTGFLPRRTFPALLLCITTILLPACAQTTLKPAIVVAGSPELIHLHWEARRVRDGIDVIAKAKQGGGALLAETAGGALLANTADTEGRATQQTRRAAP